VRAVRGRSRAVAYGLAACAGLPLERARAVALAACTGLSLERARAVALAACTGLSLAGCAGATPDAVVVQNHVSVAIVPPSDELPFDPANARLEEASAQLATLAGHPIAFEFDVALVPGWRAGFQDVLIGSIESVARDLDELRRDHPLVFERGAPRLERVVAHYDDAVVDQARAKIDLETGVLTLTGPARPWGVLGGQTAGALEDEYARWEAARFATVRAQDVPPSERRSYFEFLTNRRDPPARDPREPREPDPDAVVGAVALTSLVGDSDPRLAADVRSWLMGAMRDFASAYGHDGARIVALSPRSRWKQAEASWVAWANARLPSMTDEEKLALVESVFVRARGADGVDRGVPFAFPGFDRFAFGLSIADAWARAGHPTGSGPPPSQLELFSAVVCPKNIAADGAVSSVGRCDYSWYRDALDDQVTTRRLIDALLARKDRELVGAAFAAIDFMPAAGDKLDVLFSLARSLDADDALWRRAFHVIADDRAEGGEVARWVEEARRQWTARPTRRGVLLYALAQVDRYGESDRVAWDRFAATFGAPVDAHDLGAYLDEGVRAMSLVRAVWPALSPGWSRAAVLVPRLDAYLSEPATRLYDPQGPERSLGAIAERLCAEGAVADMAQIHAFLERRIATHPGEDYASVFASKPCGRRSAAVARTPRPPAMAPVR
jgi:hypothetical protein